MLAPKAKGSIWGLFWNETDIFTPALLYLMDFNVLIVGTESRTPRETCYLEEHACHCLEGHSGSTQSYPIILWRHCLDSVADIMPIDMAHNGCCWSFFRRLILLFSSKADYFPGFLTLKSPGTHEASPTRILLCSSQALRQERNARACFVSE